MILFLFYLWISVPPIFNRFLCLISKICWTTHQIIVLQWLAKCLACHISKHFQYPLKQLSNAFIWSLFVAYYMHRSAYKRSAWWQVKQKMQSKYPETFFVTQKNTGLNCASCVVIVMLVLHKWLVVGDNFHSLPVMDSRLHWHEPAT